MSEIEAMPGAVLVVSIGPSPGREQHSQLVRAILSRSPGRAIEPCMADACLVFGDWRAGIRSALSLISQLGRLPAELAGIDVRVGLDLQHPSGDAAGVRRVARIARSAGNNEIHLGAELADLVRADPPDGRIVRGVEAPTQSRNDLYRLGRAIDEVPNNLGRELGPFIGRASELDDIPTLFEAGRFVTISGPPGTGKSRLAVETAERVLGRYEDGAFFVGLAPITDPQLMIPTLADVIDAPIPPGSSAIEAVVAFLRPRRMLIVLDNFEHITSAAGDLGELIAAGPGVQIVVTSRTPLRVAGERELVLAPLDVPAAGSPPLGGERSAAVELFVLRATTAQPSFRMTADNAALVIDVCRRVDGLPLAIELAAARLRVLALAAISERLASRLTLLGGGPIEPSTRHQSLRTAIAWSYDLLDGAAQRLFGRLSVFRGGWSVDGAAAISVAGIDGRPDDDVLDALSSLQDASLVVRDGTARDEPRFTMLESLREFAVQQLDESGETDRIRESHARHLFDVATRLGPALTGPDQGAALDRLDAELDNLRAALRYLIDTRPGDALRLSAAIWRFWQMRGHLVEGSRIVAEALLSAGDEVPVGDRAAARSAAGGLAYWQGNLVEAEMHYEQAVILRRELRDEIGLADALLDLAFVFDPSLRPPPEDHDRTAAGIRLIEEAHRRYLVANHGPGIAKAEWVLGSVVSAPDIERGLALLDSSVKRFREQRDPFGLGWALHSYGLSLLMGAAAEPAAAALREALTIFAAAGDSSATGLLLDDFAELARAEGQALRAARLKGAAAGLRRATQADLAVTNAPWLLGQSNERGLIDPADLEQAWREGQALSQRDAIAFALGSDADPVGAPGLRVSALGTLIVERAGLPVAEWGGRKAGHRHALAIFAFLLDRVDRGVTKDECIEVLWPDADVTQGDLNFHRTLGGLRATLGAASVLFAGGRYRLGPGVVAWLDVEEFERHLLNAADATDALAAIRSLEAARTLCRGDYLDDCPLYGDSEYVEERRRAIRSRLVDALVDLGRRYEARGDASLASARYHEALAISGGDCPAADSGLERLGIARS
ncbi:MAG: NACHT domain-containing protein [Candidatus Limnocylindrales bacterium]